MKKTSRMRPLMFRDETAADRIKKAKAITDLKNLGPSSQAEFLRAGIKTVGQFTKLGWKGTLRKLAKVNPKNSHSIFAYALIGALQNVEWNRISELDKQQAREFCASLREKSKK